jgi:hypothetical protein
MKKVGRSQLSFTLDGSPKVTSVDVSLHVPPQRTTGVSAVCCLVASSVEFEIPTMV